MNRIKSLRVYRDTDRTAFVRRLEKALANPYILNRPNIKPPSDYSFAHGVLSGYVTGLQGKSDAC